ncbi:MAG TPA: hypothetical protein VJA16_15940 [Thermoanaerobaculia bacterium]
MTSNNQWVASWGPSRLDILGVGQDEEMFHKWWNGSWGPSLSDWQQLGGQPQVFTSPPAVVSWGPNRLDIFVLGHRRGERSQVQRMYHKSWDGSNWNPSLLDWEHLGGLFLSPPDAPAAVSWGPNRLDIFGVGQDQGMYHKWWDGSNWGPGDWEPLGGVFTSPPAVVSWGPNRLDIFGMGQDKGMFHKWWDGSNWSDWEPLGGVFTMP